MRARRRGVRSRDPGDTALMAELLQVLLDEEEYREIRDAARRERMPVAEWVRRAVRDALRDRRSRVDKKLRAIAEAARHEFPTADIDDMLGEIATGQRLD